MWQKAIDVTTNYELWVRIGPPRKASLRHVDEKTRTYGDPLETEFYETNILNPVPDARYPHVFMPKSVLELVGAFKDTVPEDRILFEP